MKFRVTVYCVPATSPALYCCWNMLRLLWLLYLTFSSDWYCHLIAIVLFVKSQTMAVVLISRLFCYTSWVCLVHTHQYVVAPIPVGLIPFSIGFVDPHGNPCTLQTQIAVRYDLMIINLMSSMLPPRSAMLLPVLAHVHAPWKRWDGSACIKPI